jgi:lactoylglutathione lyase
MADKLQHEIRFTNRGIPWRSLPKSDPTSSPGSQVSARFLAALPARRRARKIEERHRCGNTHVETGGFAMPDLGLTHVALTARDLDASIAFYAKYAGMAVVHRRARERIRSAWLSDHTRPFVIVLVEATDRQDHPLGPFGHLGVACASREEIDRLYAEACREGRPTRAPIDAGDPVGYTARIADPDGHSLELSFGQEIGLTVQSTAKA